MVAHWGIDPFENGFTPDLAMTEAEVQPPVGFWDPLGLSASGNLSDWGAAVAGGFWFSHMAMVYNL